MSLDVKYTSGNECLTTRTIKDITYCHHTNSAATSITPIIAGRATAAPLAAGSAPEKSASSWVKMQLISDGVNAELYTDTERMPPLK